MSRKESFRLLDDNVNLIEAFAALRRSADGQTRTAIQEALAAGGDRTEIRKSLLRAVREGGLRWDTPIPRGERAGQAELYQSFIDQTLVQQALIEALIGLIGPAGLLDDSQAMAAIDSTGMLTRLGRWTEHIRFAAESASRTVDQFKSKYGPVEIRQVQVFGLGGSGAPHDIAAEIIGNWRRSSAHIEVVHADAPYPEFTDRHTLAIVTSFSGNTEETLNCYDVVRDRAGSLMALGQGGRLLAAAERDGVPFLRLPDDPDMEAFVLQPRESVCLQCMSLLVFLAQVGLPAGAEGGLTLEDLQLADLTARIQQGIGRFQQDVPWVANPAKRVAVFLAYGLTDDRVRQPVSRPWQKKIPFVLADRRLAALAHEVRTQLHERAKINAACYEAPEFLHNLVESMRSTSESAGVGLDHDPWVYYLIRSSDEEPRIGQRLNKTLELVMQGRGRYCELWAEGDNPLQRALFATQFNAYMTTYLAALNGVDPLPVPTMSWLKEVMAGYPRDEFQPWWPTDASDCVQFSVPPNL